MNRTPAIVQLEIDVSGSVRTVYGGFDSREFGPWTTERSTARTVK
jgi:hypothetical protein